jgi:tRNA dimethylallyltransferase
MDPTSCPSHLPPLCLVGPTAVGKSAVALALAEQVGGEIISVDSMQVYRGLDIGTSKPSPAERARIPHHLIDVASLDESFDAARFVELTRVALADIQERGPRPILCGGTGFYLRAWLEGLGDAPPSAPLLRAELEAIPLDELCRELEARDPATFQRIDRANRRRVVRALEVIRLTGRPFPAQRAAWSPGAPPSASTREPPGGRARLLPSRGPLDRVPARQEPRPTGFVVPEHGCEARGTSHAVILGLTREPADLRQRIDARVEAMFAAGLVRETQSLLEHGLAQNRTAMQAIGYRQVVEHLEGHRNLTETIALVKLKTWQYARRQATWFRHQLVVTWLPVQTEEPVASVLERVLERLSTADGGP